MITVGSVFAGIGGFDLAFERAGAKVIWNCEVDRHCRAVLGRHWPGVPRFKDVRTVTGGGLRAAGLRPDVLVGGFPCQDVSVAGARAGLGGERSGLFFEFARLLDEIGPEWTVIENVPGLLSSQRGRDMGTVLGVLADLGYVGAWRVLDAQYFGVAQRRRRVFLVGCAGNGARAAEVLLEPEGGGGDPPARRAAGEGPAAGAGRRVADDGRIVTALSRGLGSGRPDAAHAQAGWLVPAVSHSLCAPRTGGPHNDHNGETLLPVAYSITPESGQGADLRATEVDTANGITVDALERSTDRGVRIVADMAVRRLTPLECLRLQGFPDDWLDGLGLADSVKYRMAGNAVAVPVVTWIARRLVARAR